MIIVISSPSNITVTGNNVDIMYSAAKRIDNDVKLINSYKDIQFKSIDKETIFITSCLEDANKVIKKGFANVYSWIQGIIPEESYMRHHSMIRLKILSLFEKRVLKRIKGCFFVSKAMLRHYESKYKLVFKNYIIFPCFNTHLNEFAFELEEKYKNNLFVYAGGTAIWQGLDYICYIYSKIEEEMKNAKILFLVKDKEYVLSLVNKYNIKNFSIDYVSKEKLPLSLSDAKFGFILRDDDVVNKVSTPTKISTYLSCGVIPIFTKSINDFYCISKTMKYAIPLDEKTILEDVAKFQVVDKKMILDEYRLIFNSYYSNENYINQIVKMICDLENKEI